MLFKKGTMNLYYIIMVPLLVLGIGFYFGSLAMKTQMKREIRQSIAEEIEKEIISRYCFSIGMSYITVNSQHACLKDNSIFYKVTWYYSEYNE